MRSKKHARFSIDHNYETFLDYFQTVTPSKYCAILHKYPFLVYLRTDVETLKKHIKKRGRAEEADIDPEFLEGLQRYHDDWLYYQNSTFPLPAPVLVLDAGLSVEDFTQEVLSVKDQIIPPHVLE